MQKALKVISIILAILMLVPIFAVSAGQNTGDYFNISLYGVMLLISLAGLIFLKKFKTAI